MPNSSLWTRFFYIWLKHFFYFLPFSTQLKMFLKRFLFFSNSIKLYFYLTYNPFIIFIFELSLKKTSIFNLYNFCLFCSYAVNQECFLFLNYWFCFIFSQSNFVFYNKLNLNEYISIIIEIKIKRDNVKRSLDVSETRTLSYSLFDFILIVIDIFI